MGTIEFASQAAANRECTGCVFGLPKKSPTESEHDIMGQSDSSRKLEQCAMIFIEECELWIAHTCLFGNELDALLCAETHISRRYMGCATVRTSEKAIGWYADV
jgi:hypothetical protein